MPAAREIARQLDVAEPHLHDSADLEAATLEQRAHGGAPMRSMRFHEEPSIRTLAARGLDAFEFNRVFVVLNDAGDALDIEVEIGN